MSAGVTVDGCHPIAFSGATIYARTAPDDADLDREMKRRDDGNKCTASFSFPRSQPLDPAIVTVSCGSSKTMFGERLLMDSARSFGEQPTRRETGMDAPLRKVTKLPRSPVRSQMTVTEFLEIVSYILATATAAYDLLLG